MEPQAGQARPTNPLLAHLNDEDEAHASTRVDFLHPGTVVQPMAGKADQPAPEAPPKPEVPVPPAATPPPGQPSAPPKSPHNGRPFVIIIIIMLLLAAGGGAYWWFKVRKPVESTSTSQSQSTQTIAATPSPPTNLSQKNSSGQAVAAGGAVKNPLELDFNMNTNANSGSIEPQVEVQPAGTAFTGQPNYKGSPITPNGSDISAKVSVTDLKDGSYHWQARFAVGDQTSTWVAFGTTSAADFTVDSTAPKAATVTTVGSQSVKAGAVSFTTTQNPTTLSGTAEAGAAISVTVSPDNQTATATTDSKGKWTVTFSQSLANGDHTVAITTSDAAGNTSSTSFTVSANTPAAAPATTTVAATGDNTRLLTLIGLALALLSGAGLILVARHGQHKV